MAQLNLTHTLTAGTPENINDVQDNFQDIVDHVNDGLIGDDNLTSPNNSVWRPVFEVAGCNISAAAAAGTYVLVNSDGIGSSPALAPIWTPDTDSVAVDGKTTQIRVVSTIAINATAPAVNLEIGLFPVTAIAGGSGAMSFTLGTVVAKSAYVNPPNPGSRAASAAVSLSSLSAIRHCLAVVISGGTGQSAANSMVAITAAVEMRHT